MSHLGPPMAGAFALVEPLLRRRALYAQARVGDGAVRWAVAASGRRAGDVRAAEGC